MYSINKRIPIEFPVTRDTSRHLDFEEVYKKIYPQLKDVIDKKWVLHKCPGCVTRLVVMDGNMKVIENNLT